MGLIPHSIPYSTELYTCSRGITPTFCLLLSSTGIASRLPPTSPKPSMLGVGKKWGGAISRAANLNQLKGYSMWNGSVSNKSWERGRRRGGSCFQDICPLATHIEVLLPGSWPNIVSWWEVQNNCFLHLCFRMAFFFPFNSIIHISTHEHLPHPPPPFFFIIFSPCVLLIRGSEREV